VLKTIYLLQAVDKLLTASKGIFFRTRYVPRALAAELISIVAAIEKDDIGLPVLSAKINKWFSDWRYQLKRRLTQLARSYNAL
jgi:hypothetical protein